MTCDRLETEDFSAVLGLERDQGRVGFSAGNRVLV